MDDKAWELVPDFSAQLQAAMDYSGKSISDVADGLAQVGLGTHPQHIHRLLKGDLLPDGTRKRANPTFVLIGAIAQVCQVPPAWFFDTLGDSLEELIARYDERSVS